MVSLSQACLGARSWLLRAAFEEPFSLGDLSASIGASVGGVVCPEDGRTVSALVRRADAAMYEDKAEHRRTTLECPPRAPDHHGRPPRG
jgi:predicted signal transduction protein with EAL and GGDEF domain